MSDFQEVTRQQFRRYFQPSRLVIGIIPEPVAGGWNLITLSFNMYCSYRPPMMAVAIHNVNRSYELFKSCREFVLAVPGESLARESMACGTLSKAGLSKATDVDWEPGLKVAVPGLRRAIANIELVTRDVVAPGDHVVVIGEVVSFRVNAKSRELPLLSVGPRTAGYRVLSQQGIHRIAVVDAPTDAREDSDIEEPELPS